ncbi:ArsI/CadI family heavy metal resistance metalloenzyme [Saccharopolyspora sp. 5N102]|uniref:ArsI/CadI family heavy metal resistance metalloenzyme n=1 Tax=Saccharopolyspora sp. 5N102 TaxID=3375155 RepID=UPI00378C2CB1
MARVQLALKVSDLEASIDFYSKLFNTKPTKLRPGYANFAVTEPPLKLVLLEGEPDRATVFDHLGVEVDSTEQVDGTTRRLSDEGLETTTEEEVACCYASMDRVWVYGPGKEPWEVYVVKGEANTTGDGGALNMRELNRALLARQLLLERRKLRLANVLEHLVGVNAENSDSPYIGLWSRLEDFQFGALSELISEREAGSSRQMRGAMHLTSAADIMALRPWVQQLLEEQLKGKHGEALDSVDLSEVVESAKVHLAEKPLTHEELGKALAERWPQHDATALAQAAEYLLPLVQVPPGNTWGSDEAAANSTVEAWFGRPIDDYAEPDKIVLRYLSVFGPAAIRDAEYWSGIKGLKDVFERLRPQLKTFRDERGKELFDLPNAPRPGADAPAPVRFLPESDNILLSHADRHRIITDDDAGKVFTTNDSCRATVLIDGYVGGTWSVEHKDDTAILKVRPFKPLSDEDSAALSEEGARLLDVVAAGAGAHEVEIASAD